jgi:hypothetical protein
MASVRRVFSRDAHPQSLEGIGVEEMPDNALSSTTAINLLSG